MLLTTVWMACSSAAAFAPLGGVKTHTLGPNSGLAYTPHVAGGAARTVLAGAEMPARPPMTNAPATRADERPHRPPPRRASPRAHNRNWILVIVECLPVSGRVQTYAAAGSQQGIATPGALPACLPLSPSPAFPNRS